MHVMIDNSDNFNLGIIKILDVTCGIQFSSFFKNHIVDFFGLIEMLLSSSHDTQLPE